MLVVGLVKTNRQIAEECAQAAWSWLCERYDIPIPRIQQVIKTYYFDTQAVDMPGYRVSMSHRKAFTVPGIPGTSKPEVVISGQQILWLPGCRANNTIESWTLQFVGEFTRALELQRPADDPATAEEPALKSTLNKIEFAKLFFPHLYRKERKTVTQILRKTKADLRKLDRMKVA